LSRGIEEDVKQRSIVLVMALAACTSGADSAASVTESAAPPSASPVGDGGLVGAPIDVAQLRGWIAFSDETRDVWIARADGSEPFRVTRSAAQEFDPSLAPDGRRIVYRHQRGDDGTTEIYVVDARGSSPRNLTRNDVADWGPDWSPNGQTIVWNSAVGTFGLGFYAYTMQPDGSGVRRITKHYVEYPAWSPDGSQIAFMAQEPGAVGTNPDYNIFVMDRDGSHMRRLTTTPGSDGWPAWSPDGSRIVFSSTRDDCSISEAADCRSSGDVGPWHDVWIMRPDGSDQTRVTPDFGQFFTWSPDGQAILVAGSSSLFVIRPDGTGMVVVPLAGVSHPLFPDWVG
jgi:Tol biopolymer transport system component